MRRSRGPPRALAKALAAPPPGYASRPLPLFAYPALTSTVGIGAAKCSGVKFPNSSASTSMLLTKKEEANKTLTPAFAASSEMQHSRRAVRGGLSGPRRAG